jgi:hypothetical protein
MISYYINEFLILNINFEPININYSDTYYPISLSEKFKNIYNHLLFKLLNFQIDDDELKKLELPENYLILYIGCKYFINLNINSSEYKQNYSYIFKCCKIVTELKENITEKYLAVISQLKSKEGFNHYKLIEIDSIP